MSATRTLGYPVDMTHVARFWHWIVQRLRINDATIAVMFVILALVDVHSAWAHAQPDPPWVAVALVLVVLLPLGWRCHYPIAVLMTLTAVMFAYRLTDIPENTWAANAWLLALYGFGAYGGTRAGSSVSSRRPHFSPRPSPGGSSPNLPVGRARHTVRTILIT